MQPSLDNAIALSFREQPGDGRPQFGNTLAVVAGGREDGRKCGGSLGERGFDCGDAARKIDRLYLIAFG
jgi:hypothetical protein